MGVTADRRREELAALLRRQGAEVLEAPALRSVPLHDDRELELATRAVLDAPVDVVVAITGVGFRGWMAAADGWGLGEALRRHLTQATIVARGPKATGAVREAGLRERWSPPSESSAELLAGLLQEDQRGRTIVVQEHGEPLAGFTAALERAGARVLRVPVYRWTLPDDRKPLERLVDAACAGWLDAVTFTSAPAAGNLFRVAAQAGREAELTAAFRNGVVAACVGPVCAAPLAERGIPALAPERYRLGAMVRLLAEQLPARRGRTVRAAGHELTLRGRLVLVDGREVSLAPAPAAVLRALASEPGRVLSRAELLERAWGGEAADEHAVEVAIGRLRRALGPAARAVQTVVKRGYRLAVSP